jgi:hypothetical protein
LAQIYSIILERNDMDKPRIFVDFCNMLADGKTVALSRDDTKKDSEGNIIKFFEGMLVSIYSNDNLDENGNIDNLLAEGIVVKNDISKYIKWWCQIDENGIIYESDIKK